MGHLTYNMVIGRVKSDFLVKTGLFYVSFYELILIHSWGDSFLTFRYKNILKLYVFLQKLSLKAAIEEQLH